MHDNGEHICLIIKITQIPMLAQTHNMQLKIPIRPGISAADLAEVQRMVPGLVSLVLERRELRSVADRDSMVEFLLKDIPTKRIDMRRVTLEARVSAPIEY
jgi:hypothetical protein